jgi:16S rRNA (cytidine1402-2'-O)-methyltransferase
MSKPCLYLIPNLLGQAPLQGSLPPDIATVVSSLWHFLVEEEKSARALIKLLNPERAIRELSIQRLNEHTKPEELESLIAPMQAGHSMGIISEAGCPAVADPGAPVVNIAHQRGWRVVPLVGPCSMILALMASGLNGQSWRFTGYLAIDNPRREAQIRELDHRARSLGETQIVMDTPYRNEKLLKELISLCHPETKVCVAQALTTPQESIVTRSVSAWRKAPPDLTRLPTVFLIG